MSKLECRHMFILLAQREDNLVLPAKLAIVLLCQDCKEIVTILYPSTIEDYINEGDKDHQEMLRREKDGT